MSNKKLVQKKTAAGHVQGYHVGSDASPRDVPLTRAEESAVREQRDLITRLQSAQEFLAVDNGPNDPTADPYTGYSRDGNVKVKFDYIGEGNAGDFNDTDPDDVALMRFDAFIHRRNFTPDDIESSYDIDHIDGDWVQPSNSSYCTQVPHESDPLVVHHVGRRIAEQLSDHVGDGGAWRRECELMSWATPAWADPDR